MCCFGACPAAAWDPNSHWSRIWDWLQKYVWWEVKNILPFVLFADYWYLQSGLEACREEETASGSRYPWISRVKRKKRGRMSASGNHKTEQGRPVFAILFLNSLIHAATPPPFWFIQGGFNLHSGPVIRFANQFLSPLCGPLSVLFYLKKLARMGILFLLFGF